MLYPPKKTSHRIARFGGLSFFIIIIICAIITPVAACDHCGTVQVLEPNSSTSSNQPTVTPTIFSGPYWGIGQMWADIDDPGHCPTFAAPVNTSLPFPSILTINLTSVNQHDLFDVGHTGLDLVGSVGDTVKPAANGVVIWAGFTTFGLGNTVAIYHGNGWFTLYAHLSEIYVTCAQSVTLTTLIGTIGMSGQSNYAHVHLELRNGQYSYNPLLFTS